MDRKKKIILGATVAAVALAIGAIAVTQGSRLKTVASVAQSATMNEEQVAAKNEENAQMAQEMQEEYQIPEITLTPEMQAAIADGSMTLEEAAAQLLSGGAAPSEAETADDAQASEAFPAEGEGEQAQTAAEVQTPEIPTPEVQTPEQTQTPPEVPTPEQTQRAAEVQTPEQTQTAPETASLSGEAAAEADSGQTQAPAKQPDNSQEKAPEKSADSGQTQAPAKQPDSGQTKAPEKSADSAQTQTPAKQPDNGQTQAPEKSAAEKAKEEKDAKVQNLFAQLYVLRDSFNARLDGVINECIDEFLALDPAQQTKINKVRIVYSRMDAIDAMEAECNAQVESIASQLDALDPELGAKARQYYENEKELKKASLISQYGGG